MKKAVRLLCVFVALSILFFCAGDYPVEARELLPDVDAPIVSVDTLHKIERIKDEILELKIERDRLDTKEIDELEKIEQAIAVKEKQAEELGLRDISHEFLQELLISSEDNKVGNASTAAIWHPSEIASDYEGMYDVECIITSHNGLIQAHVIFSSIKKDPYLTKTENNITLYGNISDDAAASHYREEILKIYAQKWISESISEMIPVVSWLPWELFFTSQPSVDELQASTDSASAVVSIDTIIKFVFAYDRAGDVWQLCLVTNKYCATTTIVHAKFHQNHEPTHDDESYGPTWVYGDWFNAHSNAHTAYDNGYIGNTCRRTYVLYSEEMKRTVSVVDVYAPNHVSQMLP